MRQKMNICSHLRPFAAILGQTNSTGSDKLANWNAEARAILFASLASFSLILHEESVDRLLG